MPDSAAFPLRTCPEQADGLVEGRCAAAVNKYLFDHRFAQIMTDLHRLEAEYSVKRYE